MEKGEAGGILTSLLTSIKFGFCIPVARRQTTKRQFVLCLSCCAKSLSRMLSDSKMIGAMLCFLGSSFFGFGILWLLDRKLLTIGNVLFLSGLTLIFGPSQTLSFFNTRWKKVGPRGVVCFFLGIVMVMYSGIHPIFGIVVELFGFLNLFGNFFPVVVSWARHVPVLSTFLNLPIIRNVADSVSGARSGPWV